MGHVVFPERAEPDTSEHELGDFDLWINGLIFDALLLAAG